MVISAKERSAKKPAKQGVAEDTPKPIRINGSTHFDFEGKNLTAYGAPVAGGDDAGEAQVSATGRGDPHGEARNPSDAHVSIRAGHGAGSVRRIFSAKSSAISGPRADVDGNLKGAGVATAVHVLAFLGVATFECRAAVARSAGTDAAESMGSRQCQTVVRDFRHGYDVHTVYGKQMGARKSYNPKNKGKKSFQPILTFLAETREFVGGELHNGDRPTGIQIARHLESVLLTVPKGVKTIYARTDAGFYCWEAVQAYQKYGCQFIVVARKTERLLEELKAALWKRSPRTDADQQCEFWYRPQGWGLAYRFIALRYEKKPEPKKK